MLKEVSGSIGSSPCFNNCAWGEQEEKRIRVLIAAGAGRHDREQKWWPGSAGWDGSDLYRPAPDTGAGGGGGPAGGCGRGGAHLVGAHMTLVPRVRGSRRTKWEIPVLVGVLSPKRMPGSLRKGLCRRHFYSGEFSGNHRGLRSRSGGSSRWTACRQGANPRAGFAFFTETFWREDNECEGDNLDRGNYIDKRQFKFYNRSKWKVNGVLERMAGFLW